MDSVSIVRPGIEDHPRVRLCVVQVNIDVVSAKGWRGSAQDIHNVSEKAQLNRLALRCCWQAKFFSQLESGAEGDGWGIPIFRGVCGDESILGLKIS